MAIRSLKTGQFSRSALVGNPVIMPGSYESIATVTPNNQTVTFSNIPSTYTHLQIRAIGRATRAGSTDSVKLQLNSDTAANYVQHFLYGDGSSVIATATTSAAFIYPVITTAGTDLSNTFCSMVIDILDYTNTNKNTTVRSLTGYDANGSGYAMFTSGLWLNTAAVTSITFSPGSSNWAQYSHFALYGVN